MRIPVLAALLLSTQLGGCVVYEYEHEFWLRVDGSGRVHVTGRPELWAAFKGVPAADPETTAAVVRRLLESSGLQVRRVTVTRRRGRAYVFASADFDDVSRLGGSPAFRDLALTLGRSPERLRLEGTWGRPSGGGDPPDAARDGLMAVRFHLPSKVYDHESAFAGVERGNIVAWRQDVRAGLAGSRLDFGATLDSRSILWSTVSLFAGAIALALALLSGALYFVVRRGRRRRAAPGA